MSRHSWKILAAIVCLLSTAASAETLVTQIREWEFGFSTEKEEAGQVIYYSASIKSYTTPRVRLVIRCNALTGFARIYLEGMTDPKVKGDFVVTFAMDGQLPKQVLAHNENDIVQFGSTSSYNPAEGKSSILTAASMAEKLELITEKGSASFQTSGGLDIIDKLVHSCTDFSLF